MRTNFLLMDNKPSIDRDLLLPIAIGGFSVVGIIVVLLIGSARNLPAEVPATPSATPFQYVYLGTEPAITTPLLETPLLEGSEMAGPTDALLIDGTQAFVTPARSSVAPPIILVTSTTSNGAVRTSTPSRLPTSTSGTASVSNTYDDTDSRLLYTGTWVSQASVSGAHQGTLHVSTGIGDSVTFTFTGSEIHLFYQAGPSLGAVTITIDGLGGPPLSQAQDETQIKEWVSDQLSSGTHSIVVAHFGGGSINIDSLLVPVPTPTPTRTPTTTQ